MTNLSLRMKSVSSFLLGNETAALASAVQVNRHDEEANVGGEMGSADGERVYDDVVESVRVENENDDELESGVGEKQSDGAHLQNLSLEEISP